MPSAGAIRDQSIQALANQLTAENVQTAEIRQRITL